MSLTLPSGTPLRTVFLGGGTPSCLPAEQLTRILQGIRNHAHLSDSCEVTVEANPDSVSTTWAHAMYAAGANRISLGVQTLDDKQLQRLGRRHSAEQACTACKIIRKSGFRNISVDLMFGLPGQRLADWLDDLKNVISWHPEHISTYALTLEGDAPMHMEWQTGTLTLPDEAETADMMLEGADALKHAGYAWYEVSNFAQPGFRSRHNQLYWLAEPVAALGPGASGYDGRTRYKRIWPTSAWLRCVQRGDSTIADSECLPSGAALGEYLMLAFRTADGVSRDRLTARFGADAWAETVQRCEQLIRQDLIARHTDRLSPTEHGFLFHSTIAATVLQP